MLTRSDTVRCRYMRGQARRRGFLEPGADPSVVGRVKDQRTADANSTGSYRLWAQERTSQKWETTQAELGSFGAEMAKGRAPSAKQRRRSELS
jgi:hypothetical protein